MLKNEEKWHSKDQFMPSLLQRLVDNNPEQTSEIRERGILVKQLKEDILHNIELILNSRSHPSLSELENDEEIASSVLGLGLADFCGVSHGTYEREHIKNEVLRQIRWFEPRLDPESLDVNLIQAENDINGGFVIEMEIYGQINLKPLTDIFVVRTKLDLESGNALVSYVEKG